MADSRIVYGARCSWWDSIDKVSTTPSGLPCCPHCGGVLFEIESEAAWWAAARDFETRQQPGYVAFLEWSRGRCYPTYDEALDAYGRADVS